jgi:Ca2+-binding EF-hand superfamily protein
METQEKKKKTNFQFLAHWTILVETLIGRIRSIKFMTEEQHTFREKLTVFFNSADTNDNGTLDKEELRKGCHELLGLEFDDKTLDQMLKMADKNGDGKIQCEEFIGIVENAMGL